MKLVVDIRENKLINELKESSDLELIVEIGKINIEYKSLDVGDMQICDNSGNILCIFERKTIADLLASIKDGRYKEQSVRLSSHDVNNHNIYYLVEGTISKSQNSTLVYSTFCSLSYFKGYSLLRTNNMNETIKILIQFIKKIDKEHKQGKEGYIQSNKTGNIGDKTEPNDDYCSNIKVKKKENITEDNIMRIMLMQIPGISDKTAKTITDKYNNFYQLIHVLQTNTDELYDLQIHNEKTGKFRKINKKSVLNIQKYLNNSNNSNNSNSSNS